MLGRKARRVRLLEERNRGLHDRMRYWEEMYLHHIERCHATLPPIRTLDRAQELANWDDIRSRLEG